MNIVNPLKQLLGEKKIVRIDHLSPMGWFSFFFSFFFFFVHLFLFSFVCFCFCFLFFLVFLNLSFLGVGGGCFLLLFNLRLLGLCHRLLWI